MVDKELFKAIIDTYGRDVYTLGELFDILRGSGFSPVEAQNIVRDAINDGHIGRVMFRKLRRNMPKRSSFVVLSVNNKKNTEIYGKV